MRSRNCILCLLSLLLLDFCNAHLITTDKYIEDLAGYNIQQGRNLTNEATFVFQVTRIYVCTH